MSCHEQRQAQHQQQRPGRLGYIGHYDGEIARAGEGAEVPGKAGAGEIWQDQAGWRVAISIDQAGVVVPAVKRGRSAQPRPVQQMKRGRGIGREASGDGEVSIEIDRAVPRAGDLQHVRDAVGIDAVIPDGWARLLAVWKPALFGIFGTKPNFSDGN